ncbi:hypothetical protein PG993_006538 [Apiospora rasikravindrae]|uniref:Luciferase domain-containing protein n=1 Tax=Apiospora rasikravindrae TaxID=990691 RepID=A0ABR1T5Z3_9PEZI
MSLSYTHTGHAPSSSMVEVTKGSEGGLTVSVSLRQDPLSVTLDGPAIFTLAISLILSLHILQPSVIVTLIGLVPVALYIRNDYFNYLKLGPGGTPATFQGYLRINWFKLWALRDPLEPLQEDPTIEPAVGILRKSPLPYRCGPRPDVVGIAPQRQVDQPGSQECYLKLRKILEQHGRKHNASIGIGTSCFEKHGMGLFARFPFNKTCQGEICHVHNTDYAMHMNLHPNDVKEVLEKGWGQRHPLACETWLRMPVPRQFMLVYAPRNMDELKIICKIIEAAEWWVMAKEYEIDTLEDS